MSGCSVSVGYHGIDDLSKTGIHLIGIRQKLLKNKTCTLL